MTTLLWYRNDLRLTDNPALRAALDLDSPVVPVFLFAPNEDASWAPGGASRWWLHHSLMRLQEDLDQAGSQLCLRVTDDSLATLRALAHETGATHVFWNRRYEPTAIARDRLIKAALRADGLTTQSFNGSLLHEPWTPKTKTGGPFQVFTPFWRHCKALPPPAEPLARPRRIPAPPTWPQTLTAAQLGLLPRIDWTRGMEDTWRPGSQAAHALLKDFLENRFDGYTTRRDQPGVDGTSRLSPHLHFGELSPREIWHATSRRAVAQREGDSWRDSQFLTEIGWREFAHHLLFHFPHTPERPLRENFSRFPWKNDADALQRWQRGMTGYPIVDAGMRQLWRTGWMHNRVRMIVASFLVKDLLQPWTAGERWFWDTLVDADLASNTLGWQWVSGCGADAAPYFRIFNPVSQGIRFDAQGEYVRRWVPELAKLADDLIHQPWDASPAQLSAAEVRLGHTYPTRMVDHSVARNAALRALATIKNSP